ncbi:Arc family DNA-binding protein [Acinetobacter sp.]|uniref:Arc family DNA-binding protein n=1 Tax=Acinetobacter sp. TaxID=472 RepID=UPI00258750B8|nr:Arc family DNA-binding protein [Acinetobacter sp.]
MSKHKNPQYNLRMPEELKKFLEEQAKKDGRSLNNFLVKSEPYRVCRRLFYLS